MSFCIFIDKILGQVLLIRQFLFSRLPRRLILTFNLQDFLQLFVCQAFSLIIFLLVIHADLLSHIHALINVLIDMLTLVDGNLGLR